MPGLTYTLKADGTQMDRGLQNARQSVERFRKDVSKKPLLQFEGERKAERNIVGLATELANAKTGAEMLSISLGRVGDIFQNSLAVGTAFAIGSALFDMGVKANEAFKNFRTLAQETNTGINKAAVVGGIGEITKGLNDYQQQLKNIRAEETRQDSFTGWWGTRLTAMMGGPSVEEVESEPKMREQAAKQARENLMIRSIELSEQQMQIADAMARGAEEEVKTLEEKFRLENEIANIRMMGLDKDAKEKAIAAANAASAAKQKAEEIALAKEQQTEEEKIAREGLERMRDEQKEREQIAQKQADADKAIRDKGSAELQAAEAKNKKVIEARLTLDEKLALAKERLKIAQDELERNEKGPGKEAAKAAVAVAQGEVMDAREAQIQRIMGGSTSAAAAQRAERKAVRDRARAERILDKREAIKAADAAARGEKRLPNQKGDAAVNLAAPPDKKDAQEQTTILGKIEQEMKNLNNKLTVA